MFTLGSLDDESVEDDDITSMDFGVTIVEDLDDPKSWASFEKAIEDFTMRDTRKLIFKSLTLCCEFYKLYAKSKGFGIKKKLHVRVEPMGIQLRKYSSVMQKVSIFKSILITLIRKGSRKS